MIYSIESRKYWDKAEEIKCRWNRLMDVFPYLQQHPEKKLCIIATGQDLDKEKFEQQLKMISGVCGDITLALQNIDLVERYKKDYKVCFYYGVADWEALSDLYNIGLRTFLLDGALAMSLPKVKKYYPDITIRIHPQGSINKLVDNNSPNMFFIRPEDLLHYEDFIDVIDFLESGEREEVFYDFYCRGYYNAPLYLLIPQLSPDYDVNNSCISNAFGRYRLDCGLKCRTPRSHCNICQNEIRSAQIVEKLISKPNN